MPQTPVSNMQASLVLNEYVNYQGVFPSRGGSGSGIFLGSVTILAGNIAASNLARGQLLTISSNTALFSLLGTNYGGDGRTDFAVPNLAGTTIDGTGSGIGLGDVFIGQEDGTTVFIPTTAQLPPGLNGTPNPGSAISNIQPTLGMSYVINAFGTFPSQSSGADLSSIGMISAFSGNFTPTSLFCDGSLLPISEFDTLFAVIGTTYGGDGQTTFALPDLRGRDIVGTGNGVNLGQQIGNTTITLTAANSPLGTDAAFNNEQPSLGLTYIMATSGIFPSTTGSGNLTNDNQTPFISQIVAFSGGFVPKGWTLCDGHTLTINNNQALFALLGTTYGGDGRTTFAVPDLRNRTVIGSGNAGASYLLGQQVGANATALTIANIPAPPVAVADFANGVLTTPTTPGPATTGNVLVNDTDESGYTLNVPEIAFQGIFAPAGTALSGTYGNLVMAANGTYTYTPGATAPQLAILSEGIFNHPKDVFSYSLNDAHAQSASSTLTVTLDVAPTAANEAQKLLRNSAFTFHSASDFGFADSDNDAFQGILVTTLPSTGALKNHGSSVAANTLVSAADITGGFVTFTPPANTSGTPDGGFNYKVLSFGTQSIASYSYAFNVLGTLVSASEATSYASLISAATGYRVAISDTGVNIAANKAALKPLIQAGHISSITYTPVSGQPYSSFEYDYSTAGALTGQKYFYTGIVGQAYASYEQDLDATGRLVTQIYRKADSSVYETDTLTYSASGSSRFITGPAMQPFASVEYDLDTLGALTGRKYITSGISGQPYASYEQDLDAAGRLLVQIYRKADNSVYQTEIVSYSAGGSAHVVTGPAVQPFASIEYDYDTGNAVTGVKYLTTGITGQAYVSLEQDFNAANKMTGEIFRKADNSILMQEAIAYSANGSARTFTGFSGQPYSSYEYDYNLAGVLTGQKYFYSATTGTVFGKSFTGYEYDLNASAAPVRQIFLNDDGSHSTNNLAANAASNGFSGADLFFYASLAGAIGNDTILGFDVAQDKISIAPAFAANFASLSLNAAGGSADTLIQLDALDSILVKGVTVAQLTAGNFLFG